MIGAELAGGVAEHPADTAEITQRAGLKPHQWSAVDDDLMKLGLVSGTSATNHTELTAMGAAEFARRKRPAR